MSVQVTPVTGFVGTLVMVTVENCSTTTIMLPPPPSWQPNYIWYEETNVTCDSRRVLQPHVSLLVAHRGESHITLLTFQSSAVCAFMSRQEL